MGFWRQARRKFGILGEFWGFLKTSKKWWLAPIIILLLLLTVIIVLAGNPALAGLIYPLM